MAQQAMREQVRDERMLVTLRERIALVSRSPATRIPSFEMQVLLTDLSGWAITAYYAAA